MFQKGCFILFLLLSGCAGVTKEVYDAPKRLEAPLVHYQSHVFDIDDSVLMMKSVVLTMQNFGFIIDKIDMTQGVVFGTEFVNSTKMTVSIFQENPKQILVDVRIVRKLHSDEPIQSYQNFFNALSQSLVIEARLTN